MSVRKDSEWDGHGAVFTEPSLIEFDPRVTLHLHFVPLLRVVAPSKPTLAIEL